MLTEVLLANFNIMRDDILVPVDPSKSIPTSTQWERYKAELGEKDPGVYFIEINEIGKSNTSKSHRQYFYQTKLTAHEESILIGSSFFLTIPISVIVPISKYKYKPYNRSIVENMEKIMLVAVVVWFAKAFGYTITDVESTQESKDIIYRYSAPTFGRASFRPSDQGGSSTFINAGYETKLRRYKPKWGYHAAVRFYMGSSEFDYIAVDEEYFTGQKTGLVNDLAIPVGIIYNISDTSGLYFDIAPYAKGFNKSATTKIVGAFTIGMKFKRAPSVRDSHLISFMNLLTTTNNSAYSLISIYFKGY